MTWKERFIWIFIFITAIPAMVFATMPTNVDFTTNGGANAYTAVAAMTDGMLRQCFVQDATMAASVSVYGCARPTASGWTVADSTDATTMGTGCFAMCLENGPAATYVLRRGIIKETDWNWTVGAAVFVGGDGMLTQSIPNTTGNVVQKMGFAIDGDTLWFDPDSTLVVVP